MLILCYCCLHRRQLVEVSLHAQCWDLLTFNAVRYKSHPKLQFSRFKHDDDRPKPCTKGAQRRVCFESISVVDVKRLPWTTKSDQWRHSVKNIRTVQVGSHRRVTHSSRETRNRTVIFFMTSDRGIGGSHVFPRGAAEAAHTTKTDPRVSRSVHNEIDMHAAENTNNRIKSNRVISFFPSGWHRWTAQNCQAWRGDGGRTLTWGSSRGEELLLLFWPATASASR